MNQTLGDLLGGWVAFCEHRPRTTLVAILLLTTLAAGYVWQNFRVDSDLGRLIRPSSSPGWYQANEAFKAAFPQFQQTSIVVVSGADLQAVETASARLASGFAGSGRFEFVFAPALNAFLRDHRAYYVGRDDLDDWVSGVQYDYGAMLRLADGADLTNAAFTLADQVAATDGLRLPTLLASIARNFVEGVPAGITVEAYPHLVPETDGLHYLIIMLKGQQQLDRSLPNAAQVALIRALIDETEPVAGVTIRLTGEVPLAHEEISAGLEGIGIAGSVSILLLAVILGIGVRSWRIIAGTFALLGVGVLWTLGFALLAVGALNTLALIFVVMFFGLGVDFAVHFSLRLQESMDPDSDDDPEVHVVREIGPALLLCMVTSSIAFLSFVPTDYLGLGELGIISAGGMVIAYVLTLSMLPALFSLFGLPRARPAVGLPTASRVARWAGVMKPGLVLGVTGVLSLGALWFASGLRFDYSVLALRDAHSEAMSTLLELQENAVTTDYSINILAPDPATALALQRQLKALELTGDVLAPADLVPEDQADKRERLRELEVLLETIGPVQSADPAFVAEGLADAVEYLAEVRSEVNLEDRALFDVFVHGLELLVQNPHQLASLNESLRSGLEGELDALRRILQAEPFDFQDLPADLRSRLVSRDGRQLITVLPAGAIDSREETDAFVHAVMGVTPDVAGRAVVEWGVGEVAVSAFQEAITLAVGAIALLLVFYFRGIVLAVVVLVPLTLTTLFTFALIELSGLTLNMANILVVPLIFGLGVDTGIHVVHRFTATGSIEGLLASSTTRAVVLSALTTIGTFFSLSFSPHKGAASVGLLLTMAISIMLLVTFLVVPALLTLVRSRG